MTWMEWAVHHGRVFGMRERADVEMLHDWTILFGRAGYAPEEMAEATDWLAINAPPRFRSDHLIALQSRVKTTRVATAPAAMPDASGPSCRDCGGSGRVIVPNRVLMRRQLLDPETTPGCRYATEAVLCDCKAGDWYREQLREKYPSAPTLCQYESFQPHWREVERQHVAHLRMQREAIDQADRRDGRGGWLALVDRILERMRGGGSGDAP